MELVVCRDVISGRVLGLEGGVILLILQGFSEKWCVYQAGAAVDFRRGRRWISGGSRPGGYNGSWPLGGESMPRPPVGAGGAGAAGTQES